MLTVDSGAVAATYDGLGRMVEQARGTSYTEIVYSPTGEKLALMNGQTQTKAFVPLPGGTQVKYTGTTISTYRLPDWLGSLRVGSNPNRTYSWGVAFAPYGERYALSGSPAWTFTGQTADVVSDEYDFMFREYHSTQGRWISPDPAGMAAVTLGNPQSWNRYAYVINNPLSLIDPSGLDFCIKALLDAAGNVMACFDEPGDLGHRGNFWGGWGPGDFGDGGSGVGFNGGFSGGPSGSWGEQPPVPLAPSPLIPANIMQVLNFVLFNQPLDWNSVLWGTNCMPFCDVGPTANNGTATGIKPTIGYSTTVIFPLLYALGPAVTITYVPSQNLRCIAPGIGASVGRTFSAGPIVGDSRSILSDHPKPANGYHLKTGQRE